MSQEEKDQVQGLINIHSEIPECQCEECRKVKDRYVRTIDIDRFVDNLNDWD